MNNCSSVRGPSSQSRIRTEPRGLPTVVVVCWLLMFASFSLPGRISPRSMAALDWIAIMKVSTRLIAMALLGINLLRIHSTARARRVMWRLLPFGIFASWAMFSAVWSPMKAVSIGHAGELFLFVMLSTVVGAVCVDEQRLSLTLCLLSVGFLIVSVLLLVLHYWFPTLGSLERAWIGSTTTGIMHPGPVGEMTSVALLILVGCRLLWRWPWTRTLLFPAIILHGWLMLLVRSRVSIILTSLMLLVYILWLANRKLLVAALLLFSVCGTIYLSADPDTRLWDQVYKEVGAYLMREQTKQQFMTGTGRTELWQLVWNSFLDSPLYGHGYFVVSRRGNLDVWGEDQDQTAHNLGLQVLVSTGLLGAVLFFWGLWRPLAPIRRALREGPDKKKIAIFILMIVSFFFLSASMSSSFLGGITPAASVFFVALGLAAGRL
jgi:hypothetical protein